MELIRYTKMLLRLVRSKVKSSNLNKSRLPRWLENAKVEIGHQCNTVLLLFQPSTRRRDEIELVGDVSSIMEFLFNDDFPERIPNSPVGRTVRQQDKWPGASVITNLTLDLGDARGDIIGFSYDYHHPFILHHLMAKYQKFGIHSTRNIPFLMGFHTDEWIEMETHLEKRTNDIVENLAFIEGSEIGDRYEDERIVEEAIQTRKENGVIVLGNYDDPHFDELRQVRDELIFHGYDAHLLVDLPDYPDIGWREKLRTWTSTARFSVLVDREASGANNEFEMLREQESILALLRPRGGGSSSMIPDDTTRLGGSVGSFWFEEQATEAVEDAIQWAESLFESS